jgi:hypothetical protein
MHVSDSAPDGLHVRPALHPVVLQQDWFTAPQVASALGPSGRLVTMCPASRIGGALEVEQWMSIHAASKAANKEIRNLAIAISLYSHMRCHQPREARASGDRTTP